jgi:hypothetical protein
MFRVFEHITLCKRLQFAIESGHRKFVDFPSYNMVIFQFVM